MSQNNPERLNQLILTCYDTKNNSMKKHQMLQSTSGRESPISSFSMPSTSSSLVLPKTTRQAMDRSIRVVKKDSSEIRERTIAPLPVNINGKYNPKINNPLRENIGFNAVKAPSEKQDSELKHLGITSSLIKKLWESMLQYLEEELSEGNPVEIPNFCILSFNTETQDCGNYSKKHRTPVFILLEKFSVKYGVSSLKVPMNEGKRKMDMGRISSNLKISKSVTKSILDSIIKNIGEKARASKEYTVDMRVCKLKFKGKSCFSKWDQKFLEKVENRLTKTSLSLSLDAGVPMRGQYENAKRNKHILQDLVISKRSPSPLILENARNRSNFSTMSTHSTITLGPPYDVDKITSISSLDINPEVSTHSAKELQTRKKYMKDSLTTKVGHCSADFHSPSAQFSLLHNRPTTPFEFEKEKSEDLREGLQNLVIEKHNKKEIQKYQNEKDRFYNEWVVKQEEEKDNGAKRERAANFQQTHNFNISLANQKKQMDQELIPTSNTMNESFKKMHNSLVESFMKEKEKKDSFVKGLKDQELLQKKYEEYGKTDFDNSVFMKNSFNNSSSPNYAKQRKERQQEFFNDLKDQVDKKQEDEKRQDFERRRDNNMVIVRGNDDEYKKKQEENRKKTREEFRNFISSKEKEISDLRELGAERNREGAKKQAGLMQSMIQNDIEKKRKQNENNRSYLDKQVQEKDVESTLNRKIENSFMF